MGGWLKRPLNADLRHQAHLKARINHRERSTRVGVFLLVLGVLVVVDFPMIAAVYFGAMLYQETLEALMQRRLRKRGAALIGWDIALAAGLASQATAIYMSVSLVFAWHPTTSIVILGLIWLTGGMVHLSANYASVRLFYWATMVPSTLVLMVFPLLVGWGAVRGPSLVEWLLPLLLAGAYVYHLKHLLSSQKDTERALEDARQEASSRLLELEYMATHDALTGLINRGAFEDKLRDRLSGRRREDADLALFLIDLDGFKPINDTFGHGAGDLVLSTVARRLEQHVRDTALVARLGGDEFVVLDSKITTEAEAKSIGDRLLDVVRQAVEYRDTHLQVGASIGVGLQARGLATGTQLSQAADMAMYIAKETGKNRVVVHDGVRDAPRHEDLKKEDLVHALRTRAFEAYYQPKIALASGELVGFEALARWSHPKLGLLAPDDFLPMLGEHGLLSDFNFTMVRRVLIDLEGLIKADLDPDNISLNVSELSLATANGRQDIEWLLAEYPNLLHKLTFEMSENVLVSRASDQVTQALAGFRDMGVRVSLDDFGTGFASFQHLRRFPFDEIKIDNSFVRSLGSDAASEVIVDGFLSIAAGLGVHVVAEGVETREQARILRDKGCYCAQGHFFGMAVPLAAIKTVIRDARQGDKLGQPASPAQSG
ncbi:MAG: EAL domain-containing protein [Pseudomonadota bacterium]